MSDTSTSDIITTTRREAQVLSYVQEQYEICKKVRMPLEKRWAEAYAFYEGKQWAIWRGSSAIAQATGASSYVEPPKPSWRVRLTINKVRSKTIKRHAALYQNMPRGAAVAGNNSADARAAAKAAEKIRDGLYYEFNVDHVFRSAGWWALFCGAAFVGDYCDEEGNIEVRPYTAFHVLAPVLMEEDIEKQPYVILLTTQDRWKVEKQFGRTVSKADSAPTSTFKSLNSIAGSGSETGSSLDTVLVAQAWFKPCRVFEEGGVVTWSGDTLLSVVEPYPYVHNEFPLSRIVDVPNNTFFGTSIIQDLIPLQREYNRTSSQMIENRNKTGRPSLVAEEGSVNVARMSAEPGQIVMKRPGTAPIQELKFPNTSSLYQNALEIIMRDLDDASSQHEISKGSVPPGVEAATAIAFLHEQDSAPLAPSVESIESAHEKISRHLLKYVEQFWDTPRAVKYVGPDNVQQLIQFKGEDLHGDIDYRVTRDSGAPESLAAKRAFIQAMMDKGHIPPVEGLRRMGMGELQSLYEAVEVDKNQAGNENLKMAETEITPDMIQQATISAQEQLGDEATDDNVLSTVLTSLATPVNIYDNDFAHIEEHESYMKTGEYELLPDANKRIIQVHTQNHKLKIANESGMAGSFSGPFDPLLNGFIRGYLQQPQQGQEDANNQA